MNYNLLSYFQQNEQWSSVAEVCKRLSSHGFTAFLVGGCVRDALLKRPIYDFDIATDARPEQVAELFPEALEVGKSFGIAMIPRGSFQIEVATFRKESGYSDGRHPDLIEYANPEEDVLRRDFTINALYFDFASKQLIDLVGGIDDLNSRKIRAVGDPSARFNEDHLRLLRAVRFAAQLEFQIESETAEAVFRNSPLVATVSVERQVVELEKLFVSAYHLQGWQSLSLFNLWQPLFGLQLSSSQQLYFRWLLMHFPRRSALGWITWAILVFVAEESGYDRNFSEYFLSKWKFSRQKLRNIMFVVQGLRKWSSSERADQLVFLSHIKGLDLLDLVYLIHSWKGESTSELHEVVEHYLEVADSKGVLCEPLVEAQDLIQQGIKPGPELGEALKRLFKIQIEFKIKSKDQVLKRL